MPAPLANRSHEFSTARPQADLNWRQIPLHPMKVASKIAGVSPASLYAYARDGRLVLKKLAGRTLVETNSLIALIEGAKDWTPSNKVRVATATRIERARESWERGR